MNRREKILLAIILGAGALMLGKKLVNNYRLALSGMDGEIRTLTRKANEAKIHREKFQKAVKQWNALGRQTLSMSEDKVRSDLRNELFELTKEVSFSNVAVNLHMQTSPIRRKSSTKPKKGYNDIQLLSGTIDGEGSLEQVIDFLFRLHRQPYLVRCKSLTLSQPRGANTRGRLVMKLEVDTPILPPTQLVKQVVTADLSKEKREAVTNRLLLAEREGYNTIKADLFQGWLPPPPEKAVVQYPRDKDELSDITKDVTLRWTPATGGPRPSGYQVYFGPSPNPPLATKTPQPGTALARQAVASGRTYYWRVDVMGEGGVTTGDLWSFTVKSPAKPVQPPGPAPVTPSVQPPVDQDLIVGRIHSSTRGQVVVLQDPNPKSGPEKDKWIEVGERMYKGQLIFVHKSGVVTEDAAGRTRYFHALGEVVKQGQPLTEKSQPEIYDELVKLENRVAHISTRPG